MSTQPEQVIKAAAAETDDASAATAQPVEKTSVSVTEESGDNLLAQLQSDLERFKDLAMRSQADFDNFRKRAAREKDDAVKYANASLLEKLIPVIDNFELGISAAKTGGENSPILSGMEMVGKQLTDFLSDNGVTAIDAVGQKFDPNLHEAIAQEASDAPEGEVVRQVRKGYKLRDRLLRPANVVVSKGKA